MVVGFRPLIGIVQQYKGKTAEEVVSDFLTRKVIPFVRSQGLVDTYKSKGFLDYTIPTDLIAKDKSTAMRMDFILASTDLKVKKVYVIKNRDAEIASDHYPIVNLFDI